jgi:hypothetical protein
VKKRYLITTMPRTKMKWYYDVEEQDNGKFHLTLIQPLGSEKTYELSYSLNIDKDVLKILIERKIIIPADNQLEFDF